MEVREREGHSHRESKQWRMRCNGKKGRMTRAKSRKRPRITGQTNLVDKVGEKTTRKADRAQQG